MGKPAVFLCYQRADSPALVGRVCDRLRAAFGTERVFRDVESIPVGQTYADVIRARLSASDVVLVLIGPHWDATRLHRPDDPVAFELREALRSRRPIIPVLLDGAAVPVAAELPDGLGRIVEFNATDVRDGADFDDHLRRLSRAVRAAAGSSRVPARALVAASVVVLAAATGVVVATARAGGGGADVLGTSVGTSSPTSASTTTGSAAPSSTTSEVPTSTSASVDPPVTPEPTPTSGATTSAETEPPTTVVPEPVCGTDLDTALASLAQAGLVGQPSHVTDDRYRYIVTTCDPAQGATVGVGGTVRLGIAADATTVGLSLPVGRTAALICSSTSVTLPALSWSGTNIAELTISLVRTGAPTISGNAPVVAPVERGRFRGTYASRQVPCNPKATTAQTITITAVATGPVPLAGGAAPIVEDELVFTVQPSSLQKAPTG